MSNFGPAEQEAPAPTRYEQQAGRLGDSLPQTRDRGPISVQLDQAAKLREVLFNSLYRLHSRLAPILAPEHPSNGKAENPDTPPSPMLADLLSRGNQQLNRAIAMVNELHDRIQL